MGNQTLWWSTRIHNLVVRATTPFIFLIQTLNTAQSFLKIVLSQIIILTTKEEQLPGGTDLERGYGYVPQS